MTVPYWPTTLPQSYATELTKQIVDTKPMFEADNGDVISRPRGTGVLRTASPTWYMDATQEVTFDDFYVTTLGQGSKRFAYRDVIRDAVQWWKFTSAPRVLHRTKDFATVTAEVLIYPNVPWFGTYVPDGLSAVPAFVADYDNDIFGIDGVKVSAPDIETVDGEYIVVRTTTTATTEAVETLTAGDITQTAPVGTSLIVGFET